MKSFYHQKLFNENLLDWESGPVRILFKNWDTDPNIGFYRKLYDKFMKIINIGGAWRLFFTFFVC